MAAINLFMHVPATVKCKLYLADPVRYIRTLQPRLSPLSFAVTFLPTALHHLMWRLAVKMAERQRIRQCPLAAKLCVECETFCVCKTGTDVLYDRANFGEADSLPHAVRGGLFIPPPTIVAGGIIFYC